MNLWNVKDLPVPPINTYKATDASIDIKHMNRVFQEGKNHFDNETYMRAEHAVMSRIVYRMKQKFRSAKDFKALEKLDKVVDNYLRTNISSDLENVMNLIPKKYTDETYLPNKNLVDYILVRLQGMVKLTERIVETCKIAAYLFDRRMHTGHFWKIAFIIFSLVSRVYILGKYNTKFICQLYNKILPFSRQLKNNGRDWLPKNYTLPTDLQQWLDVDWIDIDDEIQIIEPPEVSNIIQFFNLIDDDDDIQFCDEYIIVNDEENDIELVNEFKKLGDNRQSIQELRGFAFDEDIGEVIDVDDVLLAKPLEENVLSHDEKNENGEIIEINSTLDSPQETEVITLDNSSLSEGENVCDIIELDKTPQTPIEDKTSKTVTILDDTRISQFEEINCIASSSPIPKKILQPKSPPLDRKERKKEKALNREKLKNKNKGINISKNSTKQLLEESSSIFKPSRSMLVESNSDNIITISDSSMSQSIITKNKSRKKLKAKRNKLSDNSSHELDFELSKPLFNANRSESTLSNGTEILDLCGKKRKKRNKKNKEVLANPSKTKQNGTKRGLDSTGEIPSKRIKMSECVDVKISPKINSKNKSNITKNKRIPKNNNIDAHNLNLSSINTENQRNIFNSVKTNKNKPNKLKKKKQKLRNTLRTVQEVSSLKYTSNLHDDIKNLKIKKKKNKKRK